MKQSHTHKTKQEHGQRCRPLSVTMLAQSGLVGVDSTVFHIFSCGLSIPQPLQQPLVRSSCCPSFKLPLCWPNFLHFMDPSAVRRRALMPPPAAVIPRPKRMPRPLRCDSWLSPRERRRISIIIRSERARLLQMGMLPALARIYLRAIRLQMLMALRAEHRAQRPV